MSACSKAGCGTTAVTRGMCEHHYRRRVHYGIHRLVDCDPVRAHLAVLRGLGWTWEQIGEAAGVSPSQPCALANGKHKRMRREIAEALLRVAPAPARSHRRMDTTGARRRLRALQWMGWSMREIGARVGRPGSSLSTQMYRGAMSAALIVDIGRVYDELAHLPGPSKISATKARRTGFAPPAAWDDATIDDPAAVPDMGDPAPATPDLDDVEHLWLGGTPGWDIARRVGRSEEWVRIVLRDRVAS